ncbi:MAG: 16S rRNA (cytosine(967)-C(5))-methyltransferase RsmB [Lachnospiraceae bacterium]|nr:16S rRNA (cytosine(967)-C(5))-methyltransferase RsmB [Lachnospiraceae bacterium]
MIRKTVLELLIRIIEKKEPCHIVLGQALGKLSELPEKDRALIKLLVYGVLERKIMIDRIIEELSSRPINKIKPIVRNILRIGIYQLAFTDVPDHAAVYESVALANKGPAAPFKSFINANLRSFQRRSGYFMNEYPASLEQDEKLSYEYSMPLWITRMWIGRFGALKTEEILKAFLEPHGLPIRINISKAKEEDVIASLTSKGIKAEKSSLCDNAYILYDCPAPHLVEEFEKGLFTVQDAACALSGQMIGLSGNENVLDICAAPGGKTMNAADIMLARAAGIEEVGHVTACDISRNKTDLINENVSRCGFDNISVMINDATVYNEKFEDQFDVVICDLPCSGLGIIGKKPDIRYNASTEGIRELSQLQRNILMNAFRYVKNGGKLLYSTCTLTEEENEGNCGFIEKTGMFEPVTQRTIIPGTYGADGFFMSLFVKKCP